MWTNYQQFARRMKLQSQQLQNHFFQTIRNTRQYFLNKRSQQNINRSQTKRLHQLVLQNTQLTSSRLKIQIKKQNSQNNSAAIAGAMRLLKTKIALLQDEVKSIKQKLICQEQANRQLMSTNQRLIIQNMQLLQKSKLSNEQVQLKRVRELQLQLEQCRESALSEKQLYDNKIIDFYKQFNQINHKLEETTKSSTQELERFNKCSIEVMQQKIKQLQTSLQYKDDIIQKLKRQVQEINSDEILQPKNSFVSQLNKAYTNLRALFQEVIFKALKSSYNNRDFYQYIQSVQLKVKKLDDQYRGKGDNITKSPKRSSSQPRQNSKSKAKSKLKTMKGKKANNQRQKQLERQLNLLKHQYFTLSQNYQQETHNKLAQLLQRIQQKTNEFIDLRKNV